MMMDISPLLTKWKAANSQESSRFGTQQLVTMGLSLGSHCSELLVEEIEGKSLPLVDICLLWLKPEAPPGFGATSGNTLDVFLGALLAISSSPELEQPQTCVELLAGLCSGFLL